MQKSNSHAAAHESWRQGCWVQLQQNEKPSNLPNQALLAQPAPMRPPSHLCHATRINTGSSLFQAVLVFLLRLLRNLCALCVRPRTRILIPTQTKKNRLISSAKPRSRRKIGAFAPHPNHARSSTPSPYLARPRRRLRLQNRAFHFAKHHVQRACGHHPACAAGGYRII